MLKESALSNTKEYLAQQAAELGLREINLEEDAELVERRLERRLLDRLHSTQDSLQSEKRLLYDKITHLESSNKERSSHIQALGKENSLFKVRECSVKTH